MYFNAVCRVTHTALNQTFVASGRVVTAQNPAGEVSIGVTVILAQQVLLECSFVDSGSQVFHNSAQIDFGVFQAGSAAW